MAENKHLYDGKKLFDNKNYEQSIEEFNEAIKEIKNQKMKIKKILRKPIITEVYLMHKILIK